MACCAIVCWPACCGRAWPPAANVTNASDPANPIFLNSKPPCRLSTRLPAGEQRVIQPPAAVRFRCLLIRRPQTGDRRGLRPLRCPREAPASAPATKNAPLPPSSVVYSSSNTDMRPSLLTAALLSLALLPAAVRAQEAPSPGAPPPASDAPGLPASDVDAPTLQRQRQPGEPLLLRARQGRLHHQPGQERLRDRRGQGPADHQELHPGEEPAADHRHSAGHLRQPDERPAAGERIRRHLPARRADAQGRGLPHLLRHQHQPAGRLHQPRQRHHPRPEQGHHQHRGNWLDHRQRRAARHPAVRRRLCRGQREAAPGGWAQDPGSADRRRRPGITGDAEDRDRGRAEGQRHRLRHPHRRPRLLRRRRLQPR